MAKTTDVKWRRSRVFKKQPAPTGQVWVEVLSSGFKPVAFPVPNGTPDEDIDNLVSELVRQINEKTSR